MPSIGDSQDLATAFTFGLAALAFAFLPFLFVVVNGLIKANSGHNAHSSSILSVFTVAFIVHIISCIMFMVGVKLLDILATISKGNNYLQNTIFVKFWTPITVSGGNSAILGGVQLQLYVVQSLTNALFIVTILAVFITAFVYATIQTKKDTMQFDYTSLAVWLIISVIVALFVYSLWAEIASLALFIPDGNGVLGKTRKLIEEMISSAILATDGGETNE